MPQEGSAIPTIDEEERESDATRKREERKRAGRQMRAEEQRLTTKGEKRVFNKQ
jgi:hypothetical protein